MKKILSSILVVSLSVTLISCGNNTSVTSSTETLSSSTSNIDSMVVLQILQKERLLVI